MNAPEVTSPGLRERNKIEARNQIADAVIELMAEGNLDISHDAVAEVTGKS